MMPAMRMIERELQAAFLEIQAMTRAMEKGPPAWWDCVQTRFDRVEHEAYVRQQELENLFHRDGDQ